ncbi:MAG: DUF2341 domain-containing protein, partial [Candidatus Thorarchaeota archaeon]
ELSGVTSASLSRPQFALDLNDATIYRSYGKDNTGNYGEATIRVGTGLLTILDMEIVESDVLENTAKLNYILTGVEADWKSLFGLSLTTNSFLPYVNGIEFDGLLVEIDVPDSEHQVKRALTPDQDFQYDGRYANSFSNVSDWHLADWKYRQSHVVQGSSGAGTNYKVKIKVDYSSSTSSGDTLGADYNCQPDFDDLRFVSSSGQILDHWLEGTIGDVAVFWVEIADSLDTDQTIYIYYGNDEAVNTSDGHSTFPVFFDKSSISGWTTSNLVVSTSGDFLRFYNDDVGLAGNAQRYDITPPDDQWSMMAQFKTVSLGSSDRCVIFAADGSSSDRFFQYLSPETGAQSSWFYWDGSASVSGGTWTEGDEHIVEVTVDESDSTTGCDYYVYDTSRNLLASALGEDFRLGSATDCDGIAIGDMSTAREVDAYFRWIAFRKNIDTEPTHGIWNPTNAILSKLDGALRLGSTTDTIGDEFLITLEDVDISYKAEYIMVEMASYNCTVGMRSDVKEFGIANGQSGLFAIEIPRGPIHTDLTINGTVEGAGAYIVLYWISTSDVPVLISPNQAHMENFFHKGHLTEQGLDVGDKTDVVNDVLTMDISAGASWDEDSIWLNVDSFYEPRLKLELSHKVNLTDMTDHTLKMIFYSEENRIGNTQEIVLSHDTDWLTERHTVTLGEVKSVEFILISTDINAADIKWEIDWFEIAVDSDFVIDFYNLNGGLLSLTSIEPPAEESAPQAPNVTYSEHGKTIEIAEGSFQYETTIGEQNTWNGTDWVRYIYDPVQKWVKIGNMTIYHNEGGFLSLEGDDGTQVGKLKWYVQAYYGGQWNNISLPNYQFVGFTKTADNVSIHQRFWGSQGEMNLTITYNYNNAFKILVDITNWGAQAIPVRAIWAAQQVTGLPENGYTLVKNANNKTVGVEIESMLFSWTDVDETTPDIYTN